VTGEVEKFVTITPSKIKLTGPVGVPLMASVNIIPEKEYLFKILKVEARQGKLIDFELKETSNEADLSYVLIVKNKKNGPGRYYDVLKLKTDSKIQPEIDIRVYGNILDQDSEKKLKKKKTPDKILDKTTGKTQQNKKD